MNKTVMSLAAATLISAGYAAAADASERHTVQQGDTLFSVANQYKMSVAQLKELNKLESDYLAVSDELVVSTKQTAVTAAAAVYTVQSGDSLSAIAARHKTSVAAIKQANNLTSDFIYAGQKLKVNGAAKAAPAKKAAPASAGTYTVQSGDSLGKIAARYKVSVASLKQANGLTADVIYAGQKLKVSGSAASPAPKKETAAKVTTSKTAVYKVQGGDSLSKIASKHGTSVAVIKQLNGLTSDVIFVGQNLKVSGSAPVSSAKPAGKPAAAKTSSGIYIVQSGDSLSKIASKHGTTVAAIKQANGLNSDVIFAGQKLSMSGSVKSVPNTAAKPVSSNTYSVSKLISAAKSYMGTEYVWGGSDPSGFDCSGFIYYVYNQAGKQIPRTNTDGYFNRSYQVSSPQPGDLVFFSNTYKKGISHMGIYIGGNQFIHASSSLGVAITSLDNTYFQSKFTSFNRLY